MCPGLSFLPGRHDLRPVRERSLGRILSQAEELLLSTGYPELSLTSLSSSDYTWIKELIGQLKEDYGETGLRVSLPSLRVDSFSVNLARETEGLRRSSLTLAPEAGSQRLRNVINKNISEEDIAEAVNSAVASGWNAFKLYFMIGLPTEVDEDIVEIARWQNRWPRRAAQGARKVRRVSISIANFVPKPHTLFSGSPKWGRGTAAAAGGNSPGSKG